MTRQFGLYLVVGALGSVIDLTVFAGLHSMAFATITSQWSAALVGSTHNHLWHHYKVFDHDQGFSKTYLSTLLLAVFVILASGPVLAALETSTGNVWISKLILFPLTGLLGFLVRKFYIFARKGV